MDIDIFSVGTRTNPLQYVVETTHHKNSQKFIINNSKLSLVVVVKAFYCLDSDDKLQKLGIDYDGLLNQVCVPHT